jgi:hypothetical protein
MMGAKKIDEDQEHGIVYINVRKELVWEVKDGKEFGEDKWAGGCY